MGIGGGGGISPEEQRRRVSLQGMLLMVDGGWEGGCFPHLEELEDLGREGPRVKGPVPERCGWCSAR